MQVAAPLMSGFVVYLLSLGGITLALRKASQRIANARYLAAAVFILVALTGFILSITNTVHFSFAGSPASSGPDDGPNQPFGKALGDNPGRVVWIWNPEATNENCVSNFETKNWYWKPENINEKIVGDMFRNSLCTLTGKSSVKDSWDLLFQLP